MDRWQQAEECIQNEGLRQVVSTNFYKCRMRWGVGGLVTVMTEVQVVHRRRRFNLEWLGWYY
jgi:hypothetical protein